MKTTKIALTTIIAIMIGACGTTKKTAPSTASSTPSSTTPTTPTVFLKTDNGIFAPGIEELTAIQLKYKDVTLENLKEGHSIYTAGACINCHNAKNIYRRGEEEWKDIIENMAQKAKISDVQKDAVYKYVLAIKATQPKEIK